MAPSGTAGAAKQGRKRTLRDSLPKSGFQYINHFADRDTANFILTAIQRHLDLANTASLTPKVTDGPLAEIFQRAAERVNLVPRLSHPKVWSAIAQTVPWYRVTVRMDESHVFPHVFQLLATYLMQARLRALYVPVIAAMSQPVSQTAAAVDAVVALLRTMGQGCFVPDHTNADWAGGDSPLSSGERHLARRADSALL
jgi:hypothetical protein